MFLTTTTKKSHRDSHWERIWVYISQIPTFFSYFWIYFSQVLNFPQNSQVLSHNSDCFLTILSFLSEIWVYILQILIFSHRILKLYPTILTCFSQSLYLANSEFFHNSVYISQIQNSQVFISNVYSISQNCDYFTNYFFSQNSQFFSQTFNFFFFQNSEFV